MFDEDFFPMHSEHRIYEAVKERPPTEEELKRRAAAAARRAEEERLEAIAEAAPKSFTLPDGTVIERSGRDLYWNHSYIGSGREKETYTTEYIAKLFLEFCENCE